MGQSLKIAYGFHIIGDSGLVAFHISCLLCEWAIITAL
jgi:hypothetical protein